jgi:hypothetical protein
MARPDLVGDCRGDQGVPRKPSSRGLALAALALLLPLGALTACGGEDGAATGGVPVPASGAPAEAPGAAPGPALAAAPAEPAPAQLGPTAGFTPLPTPQQVIAPLGQGRQDPFAPLPSPQAGSPAASPIASLPVGFGFTGVIQSRGLTQAIVHLGGTETTISETVSDNVSMKLRGVGYGQPATTLCVGRRGLCPGDDPKAPPLPPGWSVTRIDLRNGVLSMRQGSLPVTCRLVMASVRPPFAAADFTSSCFGTGVKAPPPSSGATSSASPPGPAGQGLSPPATTPPSANAAQPSAATQAPNAASPTPR